MSKEPLFNVGDMLICLKYVQRRDGLSRIEEGDVVKVTHAFEFKYKGKILQDITVQRHHDVPIAVIASPGHFKRAHP